MFKLKMFHQTATTYNPSMEKAVAFWLIATPAVNAQKLLPILYGNFFSKL